MPKTVSIGNDLNQGTPWELMMAGMLSLSFVALLTVLLLIGWYGLNYFWPTSLYEFHIETKQGKEVFYGEIYSTKNVASQQLLEAGIKLKNEAKTQKRLLIKIANREREVSDFINVLEQNILLQTQPENLVVIERFNEGHFFGIPVSYIEDGKALSVSMNSDLLNQRIAAKNRVQTDIELAKSEIESLHKQRKEIEKRLSTTSIQSASYDEMLQQKIQLSNQFLTLEKNLVVLQKKLSSDQLVIKDRRGHNVSISTANILKLWYPNQMNGLDKLQHWLIKVFDFVSNNPNKSSTEKGIFPAIFGTILMVLIMSIVVMPLGVLAAVYLHEYAKKNTITRLIRIAVVNLAGVPSIVYGVFGLGFFVYWLGGGIDKLFYADALPNPTFGTPGLLWSSLTLGLLTLPVVIVSTEEGLKRIPHSMRDASLALGATQSEVLRTIVLPMATPAMMTGLILAIARAAGEVAPLMLVGVVKLAQSLPLDAEFPYLHLDRKFMHLGYHIYDLSMRDANLDAMKPLIYTTSLLLVLVVVGLNLTAIMIRHHLREKYRMLEHSL